jgi:hypothetical protein
MKTWLVAALLLGGCTERRTPAPTPLTQTAPRPQARVIFDTPRGEVPFEVEVVDTEEARARGLMHRRQLAPGAGMLFLFPTEEIQSFWMRNTYLPLDMIFVSSRMDVVGVVANATPLSDEPRMVPRPSRYVVEVNAHLAKQLGIRPGTRVRFEGVRSPLWAPR